MNRPNYPFDCEKCGNPFFWQDGRGKLHCEVCEPRPAVVARRLLSTTEGWEDVRFGDRTTVEHGMKPDKPCEKCGAIMWWLSETGQKCMMCKPPEWRLLTFTDEYRIRQEPDIPVKSNRLSRLQGGKSG